MFDCVADFGVEGVNLGGWLAEEGVEVSALQSIRVGGDEPSDDEPDATG